MIERTRRDIVEALRDLANRIEDGSVKPIQSRDGYTSQGAMIPEDAKIIFGYSTHGDVNFYEAKK